MPLTINKRVWVLAERLYVHVYNTDSFLKLLKECDIDYFSDIYKDLLIGNTKIYYTFMSEENYEFADFMELTPSYKYLPVLSNIIFDDKVINTRYDGWNYYGEFINRWYPDLLELIKLAGVIIEEKEKKLFYEEEKYLSVSEDFLNQKCGDIFLDYIQKEINEAFKTKRYLSVMVLSRKLLESTIVRIMEIVFPKIVKKEYSEKNHGLWYEKNRGKYHDFDTLLENLKTNAHSFHEDEDLILELISLLKPFKTETNACVHRDYKIPDEPYVRQWKIPYTVGLARKLFRKYCNP